MADFKGYKCDNCGAVGPEEDRTRKREVYEGPVLNGEVITDFCPECTPRAQDVPGFQEKKSKAKGATKKAAAPADPPLRSA